MNRLIEAAQQALEAMDELHRTGDTQVFDLFHRKTTEALRAALAEPVQAPVAWRYKAMIGMPWSLSDDGYYISCKRDQRYFVEALYADPPQRKPLTEEEIDVMSNDFEEGYVFLYRSFARAIERAHGIGGSDD